MLSTKARDDLLETIAALLLLAVVFAGGFFASTDANADPTAVIDNEHSQIQSSDSGQPLVYELLHPTRGMVLDASRYKFRAPGEVDSDLPNTVQIILGDQQYFTAGFSAESTF